MNIIEIKALKAGSGKTTTLVNLFQKSSLKNKIILTPSNKARQVCIQKLVSEFSLDYDKVSKQVMTLRSFKRNYVEIKKSENEETIEDYVTIPSKNHITYEPYNIFVDEASMISDFEMKDLVNHWRIQNLILDGDSLQFEPIASKQAIVNAQGEVEITVDGKVLYSEDSGKLYDLPINHQILLNKQMRAHDEELQEVIDLIKKGEIIEALSKCGYTKDCENLPSDQHIAYTNRMCNKLNEMYKNPTRWIVDKDDKMHGFFKSEILVDSDVRFQILDRDLFYENPGKKFGLQDWKEIHLKPAYAITCHKLQGSTVSTGEIFIHIDDILYGLREVLKDEKERAKLFQKFLYIAVSRAVSIKQVNIYGLGVNIKDLYKLGTKQVTSNNPEYQEACTECLEELVKMDSLVEEMVDESIQDNAVQFAADDENLESYLESVLSYEIIEDEMYKNWKKEHYGEEFSEAQKGKHSKPHKPHKTKEYPQEWKEQAKILGQKEWCEKYTNQPKLYQNLKKL